MSRARGRRFDDEPKLNVKKVIATIIALIVIVMVVMSIMSLLNRQETQNQGPVEYFSMHTKNKWGVINSRGEIVLQPTYDEMIIVPDSTKELFIYSYDVDKDTGSYSTKVINSKGEEILTDYKNIVALDNYTTIDDVWYDKNSLKFERNGKYGLITYSGEQLLSPDYDDIYTLKGLENSIILEKDGKYGLYNDSIKQLILEPIYLEIRAMGNSYTDGYVVKDENEKYGIIGQSKKFIIEPQYDSIKNVFGDSKYVVELEKKTFVIDKDNNTLFELKTGEDIVSIHNDEFVVSNNKKYGIINSKREEIIEPKYDYLEYAYGDYYIAANKKSCGIIDASGNEQVPFSYTSISYRKDGSFFECENKDFTTDIYDGKCEYKLTGTISEVNSEKAYIRIRVEDEYKYYNFSFEEKTNKDVLSNNTLFLVKENDKYGYVNKDGEKIVECIYDDATEQNKYGFCAVQKDGKWGSIKADGTVVLEPSVDLSDSINIDFIGKWHYDTSSSLYLNLNSYTDLN